MEWIEIRIKSTSEAVELLTGFLMIKGIPNIRIIDDESMDRFLLDHPLDWDYKDENSTNKPGTEIIFYIQEGDKGLLKGIEVGLQDMVSSIPEIDFGALEFTYGPVNDDDWLHEWKKTYKPFEIGDKIIVCPCWEEEYTPDPEKIVFTIDPGAVFGTGLHSSTQLCVIALESMNLQNKKILDIGCGSGILSIISILLGGHSAMACDIDPGAVRCAEENARLNNIKISKYTTQQGDIFAEEFLQNETYDVVVANIVADAIIGLSPIINKFMKENGLFIASGIIDERIEDVRNALRENGLDIKEEWQKDGWFCCVARCNIESN
ncbi:MAG: 50S ribosomal protein L11 methyltransferase [Defluviitaleaceae bacterium]|nr:50S ribosomal protein L11 methyltransferase [Defluviitaleaceae bacterium]